MAANHIEATLFTGEAGRTNSLFESLVPKLGDLVLVNNIFTSIYFIGTLTVPNYKESYIPIGPRLVQQPFKAAIGEDAFKEKLLLQKEKCLGDTKSDKTSKSPAIATYR